MSRRVRLLVGSSRTSTRHPTAIARPISTSCWSMRSTAGRRARPTEISGRPSWRSASDATSAHFGPSHHRTHARLHAKQDVLGHRQVLGERQFLVDHRHAGFAGIEGIARTIGLAVEPHFALVGRMGAGEHFHQGAFAGAIFTNEGKDLAGATDRSTPPSAIVAPNRLWTPRIWRRGACEDCGGGAGGICQTVLAFVELTVTLENTPQTGVAKRGFGGPVFSCV